MKNVFRKVQFDAIMKVIRSVLPDAFSENIEGFVNNLEVLEKKDISYSISMAYLNGEFVFKINKKKIKENNFITLKRIILSKEQFIKLDVPSSIIFDIIEFVETEIKNQKS